jgi:hypothetical protein
LVVGTILTEYNLALRVLMMWLEKEWVLERTLTTNHRQSL